MPAFLWKGQQIANLAAFRAHCIFGFWRREIAGAPGTETKAMGQFGRITKMSDLPSNDHIIRLAREAMALVDAGARAPRVPKHDRPDILMPDDFARALAAATGARAMFDAFPPSARREYLEWVVDARQPATRARRIAQAAEWIAEGKRRNWKHERS
jgi:uncharacterized protein YdeI (YjbR/CyaY-like superfamily)